jgi:hypothetical protein
LCFFGGERGEGGDEGWRERDMALQEITTWQRHQSYRYVCTRPKGRRREEREDRDGGRQTGLKRDY